MKFYAFDETTYPGIPDDVGPEVRQTNKFCDPQLAADTYREHLEEWTACEDLGYDGAFVNEHHFTYFNINPSCTVLASALIARTKRMQVGVIGHVLPLRHPVQTAEEFAQMDVLSGGRFIGGVVRGVPQEYVSYNVDPFTSRERFAECFDILQRSLTEELFDYEGRFYNLKAVSVWPKPLQNPLPIWMPAGSAETIEFAAERRIPIARVWSPTVVFQDAFEYYRMVAKEKFGWDAGPEYAIGSRYVHVAETNEKAIEECREAVMYVRRLSTFSRPVQVPAPVPGIQTDRSFDYRKRHKGPEMPVPGTPFDRLRGERLHSLRRPGLRCRVVGQGHGNCWLRQLPRHVPCGQERAPQRDELGKTVRREGHASASPHQPTIGLQSRSQPPASRRRWELAVRHDTSPLPRQQLHAATRVS